MKTIILNLIIGYSALVFFAIFFSNSMIFLPPRAGYKNTPDFIKLITADNETIFALYLPNKHAKYTLLVSHGNAEDIGYILPFLQALHDHGFAVFAYDYHGYGLSSGKPNERNTYSDIDAAYEYLTNNLHIHPENIIVYGRSLGVAVALDLASRHPVAAAILQSGFVTAFRVMTNLPLIPFDKYNNLKKITQLKCPVLIIHGTADNVIPFWHGQKLYNAIKTPKQFYKVTNAGHNDLLMFAGEEYWQTIKDFVKHQLKM
jgi:abhydrolase domain-containing protein 17